MPDPDLTISEWADEHRHLPRESAAEPGPWRTERTPYLREIMDKLSPSCPDELIVLMKCSQVGGTEVMINMVGYIVHMAPGPCLIVQPTIEIARDKFSKLRIAPTISATEVLRERIKESRSRDSGNTLMTKEFPGGILLLGGSNSAAALRSMPIRYLGLDEIDAYPHDVGGEGDPVGLAMKRTDTFHNRKVLLVSTPTIKGHSRIEKAYDESDQRRYFVPCPSCKEMQWLKWGNVIFEHKDHEIVGEVELACEGCGILIPEHKKTWMLERGEWIPQSPGNDRPAGYHLSALYSPAGWMSWRDIVKEFLDARKNSDSLRLKTWVNTRLGETWEEEGGTVDMEELDTNRMAYGPTVPLEASVLTAGVDVQNDRLECEVVAWGMGEESWGMEYKVIPGDPAQGEVWSALDEYLSEQWDHESGLKLPIRATCIDTGGHHTQQVYRFVQPRQKKRIFAIKGSNQPAQPIIGRVSRVYNKRVMLFPVGTDTAKDLLYPRLQLKTAGPGYCHFPPEDVRGYDKEYFSQLTSERVIFHKGKRRWELRSGKLRNEALDCRVYGIAALYLLMSYVGINLERETERLSKKIKKLLEGPVEEKKSATKSARAKQKRRRGGFATNW